MKKTLFFLACIIGLLTNCSQSDDLLNRSSNTNPLKARWYGVKNPETPLTRGVADKDKRWHADTGISIKFLNTPNDPSMIDRVKEIASEWEQYAGIKFNFVESDKLANVRIAFDWNGNDYLTWSYTGMDARFVRTQSEPTAVLGGLEYLSEKELKGDVLRLFGQILGLEYEQRHQDWSFWRSESSIEAYWQGMFEGIDMDWDELREYVFTPLNGENAVFPTQTTEIDELSIMAWPYYARNQSTKLLANYQLSEGDKLFIGQLYPKAEITLPTIQEAWVDAGYFTWTDSSKTALRITELGAEQEILPDVRDGEQLTSARAMFFYTKDYASHYYLSNLKKAPSFNTSNITDFSIMFQECENLISIPLYNTSKGIRFYQMFTGCSSLKNIPLLDTSNGTSFKYMFSGCTSLINIPSLNTSKGTSFIRMFAYCTSLASIPLLDTSKGIDFEQMFMTCTSLINIPLLNTSKGVNFHEMFAYCNSLTSIPLLDTSEGTNFKQMFYLCESLKSIPNLNTSKGIDFTEMFFNCSRLEQKPNLDLSSANNTDKMYAGVYL